MSNLLDSGRTIADQRAALKVGSKGRLPWINQVERFFALLSEQQIKRGAHQSIAELEAAIHAFIDARNADPTPFQWTKSADDILASIERFCRRTLAIHAEVE